jgi:cysteine-rich repeat protein
MIRLPTSILLACALVSLVPANGSARPKSPLAVARGCRTAITHALTQLARLGLREVERCERRRAAGRTERDCTTLRSGATKITAYRLWEHRSLSIIGSRCPIDSPARASFPGTRLPSGDVTGEPILVIPGIGATIEASAREVKAASSGPADVDADGSAAECVAAIASARSLVANATMRRALRCQADRTQGAISTGPLAPDCQTSPGDDVIREAAGRIAGACSGVAGLEVATCGTLPRCALDAAVETGIELARIAAGECGNGVVDTAEECDDGNDDPADQCNQCVKAVCGNGILEGDEECDDNNQLNGDGCSADCRLAVCGDGKTEGTEECDDGNDVPLDGCTDCRSDPIACSSGGVVAIVTFEYSPTQFVEIAGMRLRLQYDASAVSIPGSLVGPSINQRVKNLTGLTGASFSVADRDFMPSEEQPDGVDDTLQTVIAVSPGYVPSGPFEQARFDCLGPDARASNFSCVVDSVTDAFLNPYKDEDVAAFTRCSITLETAPEQ